MPDPHAGPWGRHDDVDTSEELIIRAVGMTPLTNDEPCSVISRAA